MKTYKAYLLVMGAGFFWGIISVFMKALQAQGLDTISTVAIRMFFALLSTGLYVLIFGREKFRIKLKDIWLFIGTGVLSLLFFNFCFFMAMSYIGVSVSTMLLYTSPIFVVVLSAVFFKEKITARKVICLVMSMAGFVLLAGFGNEAEINVMGIVFGVLSGFGYALYSIFSRAALNKGYDAVTISFYTFLTASVGSAPFVAMSDTAGLLLNPIVLLLGLGLGTISCMLPFLLYTFGMKHLETGKAAIVVMIEPIVGVLCGVLLFAETLNVANVVGIVIILAAIVMLSGDRKQES